MRSFQPIDKQTKLPKQVDQIKHWLDLLGLDFVVLSNSHDGSYTFLLPIKNCPDINISLEHDFSHILFFSNGLTRFKEEPETAVYPFLRELLQLQSKYFTSRVIIASPQEDLRVFLGFRFDEMSMFRFSRKVRELIQFVKEVAELIENHKLNELWRDTEQEPRFPEIDVRERVRFL